MGGRLGLYGCAFALYPLVGVLLLIASRSWVSHYSDKPWPLLLFCIGVPLFLSVVTSVFARLRLAPALLMVVTAALGGGVAILVLLGIVAASGALS
jgi:hypothetical protein